MRQAKFNVDQQVIVPHRDSKPEKFSGHGVVEGREWVGRQWVYIIKFSSGVRKTVVENRIEKR